MFGRQKIATIVAEFLGTTVLAGALLAMLERTSFPFFVAATGAITYAAWWMVFGENSTVTLNPALTLGLWTVRKIQTTEALVYIAAQLLGGVVALRLLAYLQNGKITNIAGKNYDWRVFAAEAVGALIFGFGVSAAVHVYESVSKRAITVGLSFAMGVLIASFAANGLLNPAVAIGVHSYSFSYLVGPVIGAIVGMNIYKYLFFVNPVQKVTAPVIARSVKPTTRVVKPKKISKK
ncbi:MAG: hypothetical protein NVSMB46_05680 [Candidatus Saccharimonadales bacterium]